MNEYQIEVNRLYTTKRAKYPHEITDKLNDSLLGEAIVEALAQKELICKS